MGGLFSAMRNLSLAFRNRQARILMLGLDAAGKTTVLYKLRLNEDINAPPTVGFNVETVQYKNIKFLVWDVGGQDKLRTLWRHYFQDVDALIYVVDSNDRDRILESKRELHRLLSEPQLQSCTLLVLANKQDLPNACSTAQIVKLMELPSFDRLWSCYGTVATTGDGLYEGLDWLSVNLPESAGAA